MPERVALSSITIGEEKERRSIRPGERFTITNEQAAEIDAHDPPIAVDPRQLDAEARRPFSPEDDDAVRRVAEPERPSPGPAARAAGDGNVTREQPAGDREEL